MKAAENRVPCRAIIDSKPYTVDGGWFNVPRNIAEKVPRRLHLEKDHPISITRQIIESVFTPPTYRHLTGLNPMVSTHQNFDSLGFPPDHPGRARTDTYYINAKTLLRTHTSAHQADTFRANLSPGYLITADVYRRDTIDRSHYPIFHQMEGAHSWDRNLAPGGDIAAQIRSDLEKLPTPSVEVSDPNPPFHPERNPLQSEHHSPAEAEAIAAHLKRSLELMVVELFSRARTASERAKRAVGDFESKHEPLQVRWVEAYFPFTSPSWELEVFWNGDWLEVLGCGVVQQHLYVNADVPSQLGWAFGLGLDRLAMLLFQIPDIRLLWSQDERFLSQFRGVSDDLDLLRPFRLFSKYPACQRDVSFWLPENPGAASIAAAVNGGELHTNDILDILRTVAGDCVEDVRHFDSYTHPETGRRSMAFRIRYRSLERTLTGGEANGMHKHFITLLVHKYGVEIR